MIKFTGFIRKEAFWWLINEINIVRPSEYSKRSNHRLWWCWEGEVSDVVFLERDQPKCSMMDF